MLGTFFSDLLGLGRREQIARVEPEIGGDLSALDYGPSDSMSSPGGWLVKNIAPKTKAGTFVNELTALTLPVVYACVNRISNPISRFPLRMYRAMPDGSRHVVTPDEHPFAARLGVRPNDHMSSRTVRKTSQAHALLWGNGYLEIERNGRGQAMGLYPLQPNVTRPVKENGVHCFRSTIGGRNVELAHSDVIHIMDQSQDGFVGISQIAMARQAVGMGLAMEEFGAKFFANDAKSGGFLMHPGKLSTKARDNVRGRDGEPKAAPESPASAVEKQGGLENAHRVKVLEEGMKFITTTIPPEDAQFLGSREFQIAELARIYDVPLILLQSQEKQTSFGSGVEQLMIGFVRQTIDPWVDAWEQELNWKLFTEEEKAQGYYVKFNMNALLRGDMKTRAEFYTKLFGVAGMSPNKILALEEEDGIGPMGDHHFVPANFVTLERATDPNYTPAGEQSAPEPDDDDPVDEEEVAEIVEEAAA
jgi:HK97 family phage portal protein